MGLLLFVRRVRWYLKKHGPFKLLKLSLVNASREVLGGQEIFLIIDPSLPPREPLRARDLVVTRHETLEGIGEETLSQVGTFKGGTDVAKAYLSEWFRNEGAVVWVGRLNGEVTGYVWGLRKGFDGFYVSPMTKGDAILGPQETFPPFRGLGIGPTMCRIAASDLAREGVQRVFASVKVWNKTGLRNAEKAGFQPLGRFRRFGMGSFSILLWARARGVSALSGVK